MHSDLWPAHRTVNARSTHVRSGPAVTGYEAFRVAAFDLLNPASADNRHSRPTFAINCVGRPLSE
jgi:hypothetical protein